jgi:MFS family permease
MHMNKTAQATMITTTHQTTRQLPRAIRALGHRNFRLFWFGQLISLIGTWMQTTGQDWLVLDLTHNSLLLGIVGALQFLPILLLGLFGGVIADRFPKRNLLIFTQSFALLQAAALWILLATGHVQLWHILVLAPMLGITNALDMPTRQSFVVEMVGREDLPNAIALNSSAFNMARIVGPAIGGLLIAALGEGPLFLLNALSFIPVIASLVLINPRLLHSHLKAGQKTASQGTFQSLGEGLSYIKRTPAILLIVLMVGVVSLFGINFNVALPLFADEVLKIGPKGYGFLSAAFGVGALAGALWLAWSSRHPSIKQIVISTLLFTIFEALFALSHWYILSLVMIALVGFTMISFAARSNTTVQTVTPDHLRGRIMSVYLLVFNGTTPIGNLLTGSLAHVIGASFTLLIGATISILAAVGALIFHKPAEKNVKEYMTR